MIAKDFIRKLANNLKDGETISFDWKIDRNYSFDLLSNKKLTVLMWYRTMSDDNDFRIEEFDLDHLFFNNEVNTHKIIIDLFTRVHI